MISTVHGAGWAASPRRAKGNRDQQSMAEVTANHTRHLTGFNSSDPEHIKLHIDMVRGLLSSDGKQEKLLKDRLAQ